jgi:hypothetical protein
MWPYFTVPLERHIRQVWLYYRICMLKQEEMSDLAETTIFDLHKSCHWIWQFDSLLWLVLDTTLCDTICQWLAASLIWFPAPIQNCPPLAWYNWNIVKSGFKHPWYNWNIVKSGYFTYFVPVLL